MESGETRQERREKKKRSKRERMLKHGRDLARTYRDAILKRAHKIKRRDSS